MSIVGGVSLYGGVSFASFYSRPLYAIAILAFVVAIASFVIPLVTKRTTVYFWLVVSPLVLLACTSFGFLTVNYALDRSKEPGVRFGAIGFQDSITPTRAKFFVHAGFYENDSAYKATLERVYYELYLEGDLIASAEWAEGLTIREKRLWGDWVEIVADNFSPETTAYLYERLVVNRSSLPLQVRGSCWLRYGSEFCQKTFERSHRFDSSSITG